MLTLYNVFGCVFFSLGKQNTKTLTFKLLKALNLGTWEDSIKLQQCVHQSKPYRRWEKTKCQFSVFNLIRRGILASWLAGDTRWDMEVIEAWYRLAGDDVIMAIYVATRRRMQQSWHAELAVNV